jgi:hypothetical protein
MCLAANIPLIESGSAGYLGQVTVIKKVETCNCPLYVMPLIVCLWIMSCFSLIKAVVK